MQQVARELAGQGHAALVGAGRQRLHVAAQQLEALVRAPDRTIQARERQGDIVVGRRFGV